MNGPEKHDASPSQALGHAEGLDVTSYDHHSSRAPDLVCRWGWAGVAPFPCNAHGWPTLLAIALPLL